MIGYRLCILLMLMVHANFVVGQFSLVGEKLYLRIYDTKQRLVKNAVVFMNGVQMLPNKNNNSFSDHFAYETNKAKLGFKDHYPRKVKLKITHPDFKEVNDSVYATGDYFYLPGKNEDYVYQGNKRPYIIHKNYFFLRPYKPGVAFDSLLKANDVKVIEKYLYCGGFKNQAYGPFVYVVKMEGNRLNKIIDSSDKSFEFGQLISSDRIEKSKGNFSGISNRISFTIRDGCSVKEVEAFLKNFVGVDKFSVDHMYGKSCTVVLKKEYYSSVIGITEKLLKSGYFEWPVNELMMYECED
jgi:hypothetical protein